MVSALYRRFSRPLLWLVALSTPFLAYKATTLKTNNDIETWLPRNTSVRQDYEKFKAEFGVEEVIVIGVDQNHVDAKLTEALADRIQTLEGVRRCWTQQRMTQRMADYGVESDEAFRRIQGLLVGEKAGDLSGLMVLLSDRGSKKRAEVVAAIRAELVYCQLRHPHVVFTGAPVIVTELDRLGSPSSNSLFSMITMLICLTLLQYSTGHWKMSLSVLGVTVWSIYLTTSVIAWCGGEMNFIMGALNVMVMVSTLSIAVHFLSYYSSAKQHGYDDPLWQALAESWSPCLWSTVTLLLGLLSLNASSIRPVSQFGYAAALGAIVAMVAGLLVTPALVTMMPNYVACERKTILDFDFHRWGGWVGKHRKAILTCGFITLVITGIGITRLQSRINPVDFLPRNNLVATDLRRLERELTSVSSIEAVVDFGLVELPFVTKLEMVRDLEDRFRTHAHVRHTLSIADFFPRELPDNPMAFAKLFSQALRDAQGDGYLAQEQRLWRISIRLRAEGKPDRVCQELTALIHPAPESTDDSAITSSAVVQGATSETSVAAVGEELPYKVQFTGVSPLLANAQLEIFTGFWQSFTGAVAMITLVMILALRSFKLAFIAMIPNIMPIWFVFGIVGFYGLPVDIGMMMTGSIAIGISVDCTFHFLVVFREALAKGATSIEACQSSLVHTGKPLVESSVMSALGMLALCLSSFTPTARFGWLMAAQMIASLLGECLLLPALLSTIKNPKIKKIEETTVAKEAEVEVSAEESEPLVASVPLKIPAPHFSGLPLSEAVARLRKS